MRIALVVACALAFTAALAAFPAAAAAQEDQPWVKDKKERGTAPASGDEADDAAGEAAPAKKDDDAAAKPEPAQDKPDKKKAKEIKETKETGAKAGKKADDSGAAPPKGFKGHVVEETKDYIRCKDDVYQKFLQAREEYSALRRSQTNLLSLINREQKTLDQIKGLSEEEIEPDVRAMQVQALTKTIDDAQEKLRKLEPKLHEKLIIYEPFRSKCED